MSEPENEDQIEEQILDDEEGYSIEKETEALLAKNSDELLKMAAKYLAKAHAPGIGGEYVVLNLLKAQSYSQLALVKKIGEAFDSVLGGGQ